MERVAAWLETHAHDVYRSLLVPPSPERIRWAMEQLGADASPAVEAWFRATGGQEWANSPDAALPPYQLFSVDDVVWNTVELRAEGTLPPRAAVVVGYEFDDDGRFLLLDAAGLLWELHEGQLTKVAGSAAELFSRTLAKLEKDRPKLRGWLPEDHQTLTDRKMLALYSGLAAAGSASLVLAWRAEPLATAGWAAVGAALLGVLGRALWFDARGRRWCRNVMRDLAAAPAEPWKANAYWRNNEAFPLDANAPRIELAEVPIRIAVAATAFTDVPEAEARLEVIQILTDRLYCAIYPMEEHTCDCRQERGKTAITLLAPDSWPTRLPGQYPNRAILWQLTLLHDGREYRYWLPVFD